MQNRMKKYQLSKDEAGKLLERVQTGSLATLNSNGSPYVVPVHFVYYKENIYVHGLPKGQKMSNIEKNHSVSFTAYEMTGLLQDPNGEPCDTNTEYQSVVITGRAGIISDFVEKSAVLKEIVKKYTPDLAENELPDNMVKGTAVIEITIDMLTGKYYTNPN